METVFLLINILLYFFFLIKEMKIERVSVVTFIIFIYLFVAVFGFVLFTNPMSKGLYKVSLFPQILLFIIICITLSPIRKCTTIYEGTIKPPSEKIFKLFIYFVAIITFLRAPGLFKNLSDNMLLMIYDTSYLSSKYEELYSGGTSGFSSGSFNYIAILGGMIDEIAILLFMYYLSCKKRKTWIVITLVIASILSPIGALVQARRGAMVSAVLNFCVFYLMFRHAYTEVINRRIKRILIIVSSLIVVGMTLITISRFTKSYMDDDYATNSALYYVGQPMLYIDDAVMDPGGHRWGDRTVPLFKSLFTTGAYTYSQRVDVYKNLNVDETVFTTFWGEFVLDFGVILGILLWLLLILWLYLLGPGTRKQIPFYRLLPIVILIDILVSGWTQSPFSDIGGNIHFIFILLLYYYFKFD